MENHQVEALGEEAEIKEMEVDIPTIEISSQSRQQQQHESHQHDNSNQSTSTTNNNATQPVEESHAFDMIGGMHNAAKAPSNGGWNCDSYNSKHGASS